MMTLRTAAWAWIIAGSIAYAETPPAASDLLRDLLPRPQQMVPAEGSLAIQPAKLTYRIGAPTEQGAAAIADRLSDTLTYYTLAAPERQQIHTFRTGSLAVWQLQVSMDAPPPAETKAEAKHELSYELRINPQDILITAADQAGLYHGLQTLGQLLNSMRLRGATTLPAMTIKDSPAIAMRGFSEDYGRNRLPTLEDHKRSIRRLASLKMNTYLWFIEPDHFVYEFDPTIGQAYDRFTFAEIRELVAYAHRYHVEIIPTVELLGHMEMLLAHPSYRALAELEGGGDLCATCEDSFALVKKLVAEIAPAFDSKYFHCGLDESFVIGKGRSADAVKERGLEAVMADYYTRMNSLVQSHGKTMMMYADIVLAHPGIIEKLPQDIVMMFWDYMPRDRYAGFDTLHKAGFPMTALSGLWDWSHMYPLYSFSFRNIETLAAQSRELGARGYFVSDWGDPIGGAAGMNLAAWANYGVAYTAALAWGSAPIALPEFSEAFAMQHYGSRSPDLARALTLLAECQGDRIAKVVAFGFGDPVANAKAMAKADEVEQAFWKNIKSSTDQAIPLLAAAKPTMNADQLPAVQWAADMLNFTAHMALEFREIGVALEQPNAAGKASADRVRKLADRQQQLWERYKTEYLRTNRPLNVPYLQGAWDRVHQALLNLAGSL